MLTPISYYIDYTPISFGLYSICRRFASKFAGVAALLNKKLRNGQLQTFDRLTDEEVTTLEKIKAKLLEPVFAIPRSLGYYTADTDACDKQMGCVLLQRQPEGTN